MLPKSRLPLLPSPQMRPLKTSTSTLHTIIPLAAVSANFSRTFYQMNEVSLDRVAAFP